MDKNIEYIKNVKAEDIDWTKLFGSYSCGKKIGEEIKKDNLLNLELLKEIEGEIEHQSTLWTITPFVMIFLLRELEKGCKDKKEEYYYILEICEMIVSTLRFCANEALKETTFDDLEVYENMQEIFDIDINLEDFEDEDEYLDAYFGDDVPEEQYNSGLYYTNVVMQYGKEIIERLLLSDDEKVRALAEKILKSY